MAMPHIYTKVEENLVLFTATAKAFIENEANDETRKHIANIKVDVRNSRLTPIVIKPTTSRIEEINVKSDLTALIWLRLESFGKS